MLPGLEQLEPFYRWVGGKRQIAPALRELMPTEYGTFFEPFLGGGALFLTARPTNAVLGDFNPELVLLWECLRDNPQGLLDRVEEHCRASELDGADYFYSVRAWDRQQNFTGLPGLERAARAFYLIQSAYRGLWRVNSRGCFNTPYDPRRLPPVDVANWFHVAEFLNTGSKRFMHADFAVTVQEAVAGDFVYFDPPYLSPDDTDTTRYTAARFEVVEHERLRDVFVDLTGRGVFVMLSGRDTPGLRGLYEGVPGVSFIGVDVQHCLAVREGESGVVRELIVKNY